MQRRDVLKLAGGAAMGRMLVGCDRLVVIDPRLNPEIDTVTSNEMFYSYSCCETPDFEPTTHETVIMHEDVELARFDLAFLESLDGMESERTLECIGTTPRIQNIGNAVWTGLPLIDVLDALGVVVPPSAVGLRIVGMDDYHCGMPVGDLDSPIWLMWRMNGEPMPFDHGAPARLMVPGRYGVKNMKWLREIAFVDTPHVSYWTERGWSEEATYNPNTLIVSPLDGLLLVTGEEVRFVGTAFAGEDAITSVDVSLNGGPWEPVTIDYSPGGAIWTLWSWKWTPQEEGDFTVQVRCATEGGAASIEHPEGDEDRFNGYEGSMQVTVQVKG